MQGAGASEHDEQADVTGTVGHMGPGCVQRKAAGLGPSSITMAPLQDSERALRCRQLAPEAAATRGNGQVGQGAAGQPQAKLL